jgi:hypothetical protein
MTAEPYADEHKPATITLRKGDPSNLLDVSTLTSKFRDHTREAVNLY